MSRRRGKQEGGGSRKLGMQGGALEIGDAQRRGSRRGGGALAGRWRGQQRDPRGGAAEAAIIAQPQTRTNSW
jgi:hypothetical protein